MTNEKLSEMVEKAGEADNALDRAELLMADLTAFGMMVTRDGKRVDPMDFYTPTSLPYP